MKTYKTKLTTLSILVFLNLFHVGNALAHCDTLDGPVVVTARAALDKGDVTPLLKWIRPEEEKDISAAFQKTLVMRAKGSEAKEFADMYFLKPWFVSTAQEKELPTLV